ncbi:VOC family protein [Catellatospora vulcania]|uniref:VOC family protein n=1 Tax=Catellatospora vulcania TaxID=1460450 RepID=UPI0012D4B8FA|nr:VOC family protein [Catellatospora vulcania]
MQKITPYLWFDTQAEEAAAHYTSIFKNSRIVSVVPGPEDRAMLVNFELEGQPFVGLNGGPAFHFTEAISFFVDCADQAEVDEMWARLSDGGEEGQCGWLKDRYGVSWQIVPKVLGELMADPDPAKASRVMHAMLGMTKLDIQALHDAHQGRS